MNNDCSVKVENVEVAEKASYILLNDCSVIVLLRLRMSKQLQKAVFILLNDYSVKVENVEGAETARYILLNDCSVKVENVEGAETAVFIKMDGGGIQKANVKQVIEQV